MIAQGVSGTVTWTLDDEGTLYFVPVNGKEGTFADTKGFQREWKFYNIFIKQIKSHGTINLAKNSCYMFSGCSSLTNIDTLKNWNTQNVTNVKGMFVGCSSLKNIDGLKNWNTENVTNMSSMFYSCKTLSSFDALTHWNTENVTDMSYMFAGCSSLTDIDALKNWETQNVVAMDWMFYHCSSLANIDILKNWNIQNARDMSFMFYDCSSLKNLDLIHVDASKITDVTGMFWGCNSLTMIELSNVNRNSVIGLPINETSALSSKWHKVGTTQEYDPYEIADKWNSNFEGLWSRKKISKSASTDDLKITGPEEKTITVSLKDKMLALKLGDYSVQISYE